MQLCVQPATLLAGACLAVLLTPASAAAQVPARVGPPALELRPLPLAQIDDGQSGSDLSRTRPITLSINQPTPIPDLLMMLVRGTAFSVAPDPDVRGAFQGELKGVTIRQALDIILHPQGFDYRASGNVIRVFRTRLETRRFDLLFVSSKRDGAAVPDVFADLAAGVQTLVSSDGRFNIDRRAGLLQVTDYRDRLVQVQAYLDAVSQRAGQQISVQAHVLEIVLNERFANGIDWRQLASDAGDAVALVEDAAGLSSGTAVAGLQVRQFNGLVAALSRQGDVNVVASPSIYALNNEPARVSVSTRAKAGASKTHGVSLTVTSHAGEDGIISIRVTPSVTTSGDRRRSAPGDPAPVTVRKADTVARIRDSQSVVIAGLLGEGSPRTDIVILLTPRRAGIP